MDTHFTVRGGELQVEDVPCSAIAGHHGTPTFVYSRAALESAWRELDAAFGARDHLICYAVKANGNLAILNLFARLGAGFDIVSGGELARVLAAGGSPGKIVFSGVGKSAAEMHAALEADILCFNVESEAELERLAGIAQRTGRSARVSFRVNPDVDAGTHPYISTGLRENKFGVPIADAARLYRRAAGMAGIQVTGIDCHIGSQLTDLAPMTEAAQRVVALVESLQREGIALSHIDAGGGLGIRYRDETPPPLAAWVEALAGALAGRRETLMIEPGRALVGNAGLLLTRVEYLKHTQARRFAIVDAAMNDLIRPALYDAFHEIRETRAEGSMAVYDVVGPICESGDFLGRARPLAIRAGSLLAIFSCGAYAASMASNYNSRGRAAEVLVDGAQMHLVARRESSADLIARESISPGSAA